MCQSKEQKQRSALKYWENRLSNKEALTLEEPKVKYVTQQIQVLKEKLGMVAQKVVAATATKQATVEVKKADWTPYANRVIDVYRIGKAKHASNRDYKDNKGKGKATKTTYDLHFVTTLNDEPGRLQKLEQGKEADYFPASAFKFDSRNTIIHPKPKL